MKYSLSLCHVSLYDNGYICFWTCQIGESVCHHFQKRFVFSHGSLGQALCVSNPTHPKHTESPSQATMATYRNLLKVMLNWSKANICRVRYLILFLALYQKSFCLIMLIGWMKWVVLLENGYIPCWPWVWIWMDTLKWQSIVNFQFIKTSLPYWTNIVTNI